MKPSWINSNEDFDPLAFSKLTPAALHHDVHEILKLSKSLRRQHHHLLRELYKSHLVSWDQRAQIACAVADWISLSLQNSSKQPLAEGDVEALTDAILFIGISELENSTRKKASLDLRSIVQNNVLPMFVQRCAADSLLRMREYSHKAFWEETLRRNDEELAAIAATAIASLDIQHFLDALGNSDHDLLRRSLVRDSVARAIGDYGSMAFRQVLRRVISKRDDSSRKRIMDALKACGVADYAETGFVELLVTTLDIIEGRRSADYAPPAMFEEVELACKQSALPEDFSRDATRLAVDLFFRRWQPTKDPQNVHRMVAIGQYILDHRSLWLDIHPVSSLSPLVIVENIHHYLKRLDPADANRADAHSAVPSLVSLLHASLQAVQISDNDRKSILTALLGVLPFQSCIPVAIQMLDLLKCKSEMDRTEFRAQALTAIMNASSTIDAAHLILLLDRMCDARWGEQMQELSVTDQRFANHFAYCRERFMHAILSSPENSPHRTALRYIWAGHLESEHDAPIDPQAELERRSRTENNG